MDWMIFWYCIAGAVVSVMVGVMMLPADDGEHMPDRL